MPSKLFSTTTPRENWNKYFKKNTGLIIDLGCGYGADSYFLARKGYKVIAIDENKSIRFRHPNLTFIQRDSGILINKKFDGVIANFSLHFLTPKVRIKTTKHYLKNLKPGGVFYILIFKKFVTHAFLKLFQKKPTMEYYTKRDNHPPAGKHIHEIANIIYQKPL